MTVSVIVPAYNAADTLGYCLAALQHQTLPSADYEIIVVDDGSTDRTAKVVMGANVQLIRQSHRGRSAARNQGILAAKGELVLFTDADCMPAEDWVEAMAAPFADAEVAGCKGVYRTRQGNLVARFVQAEYEDKYRGMARAKTIDFVDTYSAGYRRDVLLLAGGFDEHVRAAEDAELSFRLTHRGCKLVFNPQATVYHHHVTNLRDYAARKFPYGRWRVDVYSRYPGKIKGDSHTPAVLRWQLLLTALIVLVLPVLLVASWAAWLLLGLALAFWVTTLPFTIRTWRKDRGAASIAPLLLGLRALALGLGLAWGLVYRVYLRVTSAHRGAPAPP